MRRLKPWGRHGQGNGPSMVESVGKCAIRNAESIGPMLSRHRFACMRQIDIRSLVCALLTSSGPRAIRRRIRAFIVQSFDRMDCRWTRSHVTNEVAEIIAPFIAHGDFTPSIQLIHSSLRIETTVFGSTPNPVLRRSRPPMFCSSYSAFGLPARAASACATMQQMLGRGKLFVATFAATFPHPVIPFGMPNEHQSGQLAEYRSRQYRRHICIIPYKSWTVTA